MSTSDEKAKDQPKYACSFCGSAKLRGHFYTQQVLYAKADEIIYVESGEPETGRLNLFCFDCEKEIENFPKGEFPIE